MSDFNRNDDLYNPDRDLRVVERDNDSGLGMMAGIAVIVLLLLGGLLFYFNPGAVRTADNSSITTADRSISQPSLNPASPSTTPQRSPMSPAPSVTPSTPAAPSGGSSAPAQ